MRYPLRIVFDTNVFSPEHFDVLEASSMMSLCKMGRIVPIYGHVFLEETLRAYSVESKRKDLLQRWLPFVSRSVHRLCDDFLGIWHRELIQGCGRNANIYMKRRVQEKLLDGFTRIPLDGTWRAWSKALPNIALEGAKRVAQRETSKVVRKEFSDWKRAVLHNPRKHDSATLNQYLERQVDYAGRQFLPEIVSCKNPHAVADRWAKAKMQYPFFTTYVINMLYMAHHAMTKPNEPIDLNAQADLNLITHLLHSDIVVSNEAGFLRTAFDDLWKPRGKVIFTSQEFADFLKWI